jgi:hypothetical protein
MISMMLPNRSLSADNFSKFLTDSIWYLPTSLVKKIKGIYIYIWRLMFPSSTWIYVCDGTKPTTPVEVCDTKLRALRDVSIFGLLYLWRYAYIAPQLLIRFENRQWWNYLSTWAKFLYISLTKTALSTLYL